MNKNLLLTTLVLLIFSINSKAQKYDLSPKDQKIIINLIDSIAEKDQRYRSIISLGNNDPQLINKDREMRKNASLEEYMKFLSTVEKTLSEEKIDSLWGLQYPIDYENYKTFKTLVSEYGYPSSERLGIKEDHIFPILLHPPQEVEVKTYLNEMSKLLKPEVLSGRMEAKQYATFYDNIKSKILKEAQLYGTNRSFDPKTMKMAPPGIKNIKETNKARAEIGLPELQKGEYQIIKN